MSLKGLSAAKHTETSPAFLEAIKILSAAIEKLNAVTKKVYDNNAVFVVVTVTEHHAIRTKRQTPPAGEVVSVKFIINSSKIIFGLIFKDPNNPYNLAELTSADYPVVFNIIFWFTVVFIFSLLAISLALSNVEDKGESYFDFSTADFNSKLKIYRQHNLPHDWCSRKER